MIYIIHYTAYNVYYSYIYIYFETQVRNFEDVFEVLMYLIIPEPILYLLPYPVGYTLNHTAYPNPHLNPEPYPILCYTCFIPTSYSLNRLYTLNITVVTAMLGAIHKRRPRYFAYSPLVRRCPHFAFLPDVWRPHP